MLSSPLKICIICRPKENERVRVEPTKSCAYHMELQAAFTETIRTADELSKMMAFFYHGAAKPPCLDYTGDRQERIPTVVTKS
ncbi:hypothetical protein V6N13_062285 [Hibiscus sabdariffa]|uniref:Uncharacterized protein n=1 Tax=Hibiscus sabdariffa TaxID=183260 RepID=A0ABR2NJJ9_9ROSI